MISLKKRERLWQWCCSRGFVFIAYVMIAVASIVLYQQSPYPPYQLDLLFSLIASFLACTLIFSALATVHAVVYGLKPVTITAIKLEIPSLRILAFIVAAHGLIDINSGEVPAGSIQVGLAMLLIHEMRTLSVLRKGAPGGLI